MKPFAYFVIFSLTILLSYESFTQGIITDIPLYEQRVTLSDNPLIIVTSNDGYDNFNLGTDFAEPHMSAHPLFPTQNFNAFNTNGAHYTLNGWDWFNITPNFGVSPNGDPVTAYDSLGNLYYETMYGGITGCYVIRSTNNGATWGAGKLAIAGFDKNWLAADQTSGPYANYLYTTMTKSGGGNFARSTDFGNSWSTINSFTTQTLPGMMVAVGPNVLGGNNIPGGCVYVVTHSGTNAAGIYTFYLSTNAGVTFTQKSQQQFSNVIGVEYSGRSSVPNSSGMRTRPYPLICADNSYGPYRGRLYLVYASNYPSGSGNKSDIFLRYSNDQGATWSPAVTVNDDPNTQNNFQWMPSYWVEKTTGRIYLQWMDSRDTPTSDSCYIYATYSTDGGASFAPNIRLSNAKMKISCTTCGGGGTPRYQGDYTAVTSNSKGAMAVWMDYRAGTFGSYTAYFPDFALKTSASEITVNQNNKNYLWVSVPDVKLYSDTVLYSAEVSPTPAAGAITFSFSKTASTIFPDSTRLKISAATGTTTGNYTVTVTAKGPNGTPVHKRTVALTIANEIPFLLSVNIMDSWNIVSIPFLLPTSQSVDLWWPNRNQLAGVYKWSEGYVGVTEAAPTEGYWMMHNGNQLYNTGDEWPSVGIIKLTHDPIPVLSGWNLIGGFEDTVAIASVTTTPPGILAAGSVYGWNGTYYVSDYFTPGYGYWVYLTAAGYINMDTEKNMQLLAEKENKKNWGKIIISDESGKSFTLYSANGIPDGGSGLLPPLPPSGCFDIRYRTGRSVEDLATSEQIIDISGVIFPIKIAVEKMSLTLKDETGRRLNSRLKPGESITLSSIDHLVVLADAEVLDYSLGQNYPNPFNPTTQITYTIPQDGLVTLKIFNAMGEEIKRLVNEVQPLGKHTVSFISNNLASGTYFYKLESGSFVQTKKMSLLK